jgi:hypothetical protein
MEQTARSALRRPLRRLVPRGDGLTATHSEIGRDPVPNRLRHARIGAFVALRVVDSQRRSYAANTPTDADLRAFPDHRTALHPLRQQDEVDRFGTSQPKVRADDVSLRQLRKHRELFDGDLARRYSKTWLAKAVLPPGRSRRGGHCSRLGVALLAGRSRRREYALIGRAGFSNEPGPFEVGFGDKPNNFSHVHSKAVTMLAQEMRTSCQTSANGP